MEHLEAAILRTILYGDIFHFPMTPEEIHHFLIHDEQTTRQQIQHTLVNSQYLNELLICGEGYFALSTRQEIIPIRIQREQATKKLWLPAITYGQWLARLPFVRMVTLTGALAMRNAHENDDFDYLIVTKAQRVWLARGFAIALVYLGKLRGITICPNYVLSEDSLEQQRKDLYIAHEITQMVPIYGHELYWDMRQANLWTIDSLPNAETPLYKAHPTVKGVWAFAKRTIEWVLSGKLGDSLEKWERNRKLKRFEKALDTPNAAAQLDASQVKGHFNDYGHPVLRQYAQRLEQYDLSPNHNRQVVSGD